MQSQKLFWILVGVIGILLITLIISPKEEIIPHEEMVPNISGEKTKVLLYFWNIHTQDYEQEYHEVSLEKIKRNTYQSILEELLKGPISSELTSLIPKGTNVISVEQGGNRVIVNFSKEYSLNSEEQEIRGKLIANSLTELKEIDEVEIQVEGMTVYSYVRN